MKERGEKVEPYKVHRKLKQPEDPVASQIDTEKVTGLFPKPYLWENF